MQHPSLSRMHSHTYHSKSIVHALLQGIHLHYGSARHPHSHMGSSQYREDFRKKDAEHVVRRVTLRAAIVPNACE